MLTFKDIKAVVEEYAPQFLRVPGVVAAGLVTREIRFVFEIVVRNLDVRQQLSSMSEVAGVPVVFALSNGSLAATAKAATSSTPSA